MYQRLISMISVGVICLAGSAASAQPLDVSIREVLPGGYVDHVPPAEGNLFAPDGLLLLDKEKANDDAAFVEVTLSFDPQTDGEYALSLYMGQVTGVHLGSVAFVDADGDGVALWVAQDAAEGALAPDGVSAFQFGLDKAGALPLMPIEYSGTYDQIVLGFFYAEAGARAGLDAAEVPGVFAFSEPVPGPNVWWLAVVLLVAGAIATAGGGVRRMRRAGSVLLAGLLFAVCAAASPALAATLSISDAIIAEGDSGTAALEFTVSRSDDVDIVGVQFVTEAGTAIEDDDYVGDIGVVSFLAGGVLDKTVSIQVTGDELVELDESFFVLLEFPDGATILDGIGEGTIQNDDAATIQIADADSFEGSTSAPYTNNAFQFTLGLDKAVDTAITIEFSTADDTAVSTSSPKDYTGIVNGTVTFNGNAGEEKDITVEIVMDRFEESDETFTVSLDSLDADGRNVTLGSSSGRGRILDDDVDTDRDGIPDAYESVLGTREDDCDSDNDTIGDGIEVACGTSPLDPQDPTDTTDADVDGIPDAWEKSNGLSATSVDHDADGIGDGYELAYNGVLDASILLGDANDDGQRTLDDVWYLYRYIYTDSFDPAQEIRRIDLDINRDGTIDYMDPAILQYWLSGHISLIPVSRLWVSNPACSPGP